MKIGIICAMWEEIELLKGDMQDITTRSIGKRDFWCGSLYGRQVVLVQCGIGKVAAACTCALLLECFAPNCIIFSGTAGGAAKGLRAGDLVIGQKSCQHDFKIPGRPLFYVPQAQKSYFDSDPELCDKALQAANTYIEQELSRELGESTLQQFAITSPKVVMGTVASGDEFVCDSEKTRWLAEQVQDLKCVEMEGAAAAQVCEDFSTPFVLVRVVSDTADEDTPLNFDAFVDRAARYFTRGVVRNLLKLLSFHPSV